MSATVAVKPMVRLGNSANIVFYREQGSREYSRDPYVWAEVLRSDPWYRDGEGTLRLDRGKLPTFGIRVYRNRRGVICETTYAPKSRPRAAELPPRTVTRLVREALGGRVADIEAGHA